MDRMQPMQFKFRLIDYLRQLFSVLNIFSLIQEVSVEDRLSVIMETQRILMRSLAVALVIASVIWTTTGKVL